MNWYIEVIKQYAVFSGRARRSEYWYFVLFNIIISLLLGGVDYAAGLINEESGLGVLGGLYSLFILLPSIGVTIRRLHDTDRTGWWIWISLIPLIGAIVLIVFLAQAGQVGSNRFGDDPKK